MANDSANYARAVLSQGLGMGWGDEAEALARSKAGEGSYEDILSQLNKDYAAFSERNPVLAPAAEFAGGLLPLAASYIAAPFTGGASVPAAAAATARSAGALARLASSVPGVGGALTAAKNIVSNPIGRGVVVGGTTGAVSGAGSAEPDRRGEGAKYGAAVGSVLGGAIPVVIRGGGGAYGWLQDRLAKSDEYLDAKALGKISGAMQGSKVTPDQLRVKIAEDEATGVPSMLANMDKSLVTLGETVANRGGRGPDIMAKGITEQSEGARDRVLDQVKKSYGTQGRFYQEEQKIIEDLRTRASPYYEQAYKVGDVTDPKVLKFMELPQFKQGFKEAKDLLAAEGRKIPGMAGDKIPSSYSVETLDQVKRGLDRLIEGQEKTLGGYTDLGKVYINQKNQFLEELDRAVPEYGNARAIFKGDAEVRDALRLGMKDFNKLDHEEIKILMKGMGQAEKEAFTTGSVRNLQSTIMDPSQNINAAQKLVGSPETRSKLLALADNNQSQFNLLQTVLERESELFREGSKMISGSPTARRAAAARAFDGDEGPGNLINSAMTGGGWKNSLLQTAARLVQSGSISDDVAERVATMLSSTDPAKNAAAVKVLEEYGLKATKAAERAGEKETAVVRAAAISAQPSPRDSSVLGDIDEDIEKRRQIEKDKNLPDIDADIAAKNKKLEDEMKNKQEKANRLKNAVGQ